VKLTLIQKGIVLVTIPLLFQFLFVGVLALLLAQAEKESSRFFHSVNIGNCSNKLIKDVFEISAISHSEMVELVSTDAYKEKIGAIRSDLEELSKAACDNPAQQAVIKKSAQAGDEAFMLVEQLRATFISGDALSAIDQLKELRGELRSCMQQMISKELLAMAQSEIKNAKEAHNRQLAFRQRIQLALIIGLVLNAAATLFVVWIIARKLVSRLKILIDNNYRLASRMPLNEPLGGGDEIANLDATFHEMATSLAEAKQKEKSMIEYSVDAICSLDGSGKITAANPACANILGLPQDSVLGNNLKNILVSEDLDDFNESLLRAKSGKSQCQVESKVIQSNGNTTDVLWSLHWVQSEESFFCVGHDITERKEVERLKQQFMAMVSHDLRTPLSTISNYLEMLGAGLFGQLTEKGEHLLQIAESNVNRMLALINDLLDLERAEFAGLKIECSPQKLNSLVDHSIKSVNNLALKKQIHMEFDNTDLVVDADNNRIIQVLVNLLSNAIKFSPKNGKVNVSVEECEGKAWVRVSDQGRGVPPHMKEKIFEHFQQVEIADAVEKGGSGLGLAICKAIVELHGGAIKVEGNMPSGSTFCFSLPLAKVSEKQVA